MCNCVWYILIFFKLAKINMNWWTTFSLDISGSVPPTIKFPCMKPHYIIFRDFHFKKKRTRRQEGKGIVCTMMFLWFNFNITHSNKSCCSYMIILMQHYRSRCVILDTPALWSNESWPFQPVHLFIYYYPLNKNNITITMSSTIAP